MMLTDDDGITQGRYDSVILATGQLTIREIDVIMNGKYSEPTVNHPLVSFSDI